MARADGHGRQCPGAREHHGGGRYTEGNLDGSRWCGYGKGSNGKGRALAVAGTFIVTDVRLVLGASGVLFSLTALISLSSRSTGGDKASHAATRNMMCCTVSGQGAGVAAAVSVKHDLAFENMDLSLVQTELRRQGVRLA